MGLRTSREHVRTGSPTALRMRPTTRILRLSRLETTTWTARQATVPIVNRWHACVRYFAVTQLTVFLRASSLTHGAR
jgi:hypothetical protein